MSAASPIASRPRLNPGPHPYSLSFVASPTPYISWQVPAVGAGNLRPADKAEDNEAGAATPEALQAKTTPP